MLYCRGQNQQKKRLEAQKREGSLSLSHSVGAKHKANEDDHNLSTLTVMSQYALTYRNTLVCCTAMEPKRESTAALSATVFAMLLFII